ncbi:phosphatidate cytidylyltransferase [Pilimelia columellifera]|uniref:Phosphatidate cytidylyltransferase n=1 Tax=Pilimelia columellifera subsp. columellifera TaxID=706583 RepID=A0ABN3N7T0_9ACTN
MVYHDPADGSGEDDAVVGRPRPASPCVRTVPPPAVVGADGVSSVSRSGSSDRAPGDDAALGAGPAGHRTPAHGAPAVLRPFHRAPSDSEAAADDGIADDRSRAAVRSGGPGRRRAGRKRGGGRNVPAAIGVGVALAAVVVVSLANPLAFAAVVAVAAAAGVWELVCAVRVSGLRPPLPPLLAGALLTPTLGFMVGAEGLAVGVLVTVLASLVWRLGDGPDGFERDVAVAALIAVYVPFLIGFAAPLAEGEDGRWRVLVTLAAVVLSDTGGYVAGVLFSSGKRPMAPTVSPNKSWEGFAGSLTAAGVGTAVLGWLLLGLPLWWGLVAGVVISVVSVIGDLAESMIKRDLGVKDMSNLLPGHGGLMDRLDSIIFAVPTAYVLLVLLAPGVS